MVSVSESIQIDAPLAEVFTYLDDPRNHTEVTPSLRDVMNIERFDDGRKRADHTYEMAGISLDGEIVERTREENGMMTFELAGDLEGEIRIEFDELEEGTEVTYSATYELPGRVLAALAEPFVRRYNTRELRTTLQNTKTRLEADDGTHYTGRQNS